MIISFTGTQKGMTDKQKSTFGCILYKKMCTENIEFHHGDCIGADENAHDIVIEFNGKVIIHPPSDNSKRAFCKDAFEIKEPKPYLTRNDDMAIICNLLIATPKEYKEQLRSGTWATIRYARKYSKLIVIILPNGTTIKE